MHLLVHAAGALLYELKNLPHLLYAVDEKISSTKVCSVILWPHMYTPRDCAPMRVLEPVCTYMWQRTKQAQARRPDQCLSGASACATRGARTLELAWRRALIRVHGSLDFYGMSELTPAVAVCVKFAN